jgi:hypothetical protein
MFVLPLRTRKNETKWPTGVNNECCFDNEKCRLADRHFLTFLHHLLQIQNNRRASASSKQRGEIVLKKND